MRTSFYYLVIYGLLVRGGIFLVHEIENHGSRITESYASQSSQKNNQNSKIQILVADHGSQIAARILKAGKF